MIEEAPSAGIPPATRDRLLTAAVRAAESVAYVGAGTVEFLVDADAPDDVFFIEMNTRLQVEHPVTEEVTGLDLVALQLRMADGQPLDVAPRTTGHAVEARVYAEAPERGFLPSTGTVLLFDPPSGVRVDAAVESGSVVSGFYDPMIAKIIAWAEDRATALQRLDDALARTVVLGVETNIAFLRRLLRDRRVLEGDLDTGLIDTLLPLEPMSPSAAQVAAAAGLVDARRETAASPGGAGPLWRSLPGWRLGAAPHAPEPFTLLTDDDEIVRTTPTLPPSDRVCAARDAEGAIWVCEDGRTLRLRPWIAAAGCGGDSPPRSGEARATEPEARAPCRAVSWRSMSRTGRPSARESLSYRSRR